MELGHILQGSPHASSKTWEFRSWIGPQRGPDLNCIEHLWDLIGRRLHNRQHQPQTLQELEVALLEEWRVIPQETIRRLIRSMSRRCQAVIRARGGNTRY